MLPCYKGHRSSSEGVQRDLNQQEQNQTLGSNFKGLEEHEKESGKYNPSMEQIEYEIRQRIKPIKTTNKKVKQCTNECQIKIVKLMCL
jgi:hypothetical protein